jgi:thiol-disulfide isomerase/thioredoxin
MARLSLERILLIVACIGALSLAGASALRRSGPRTSPAKAPSRDNSAIEVIRFAKNPEPVPAFLARDLDGNVISTAEWNGKVTLLTFWATWCGPCRAEIPMLIDLEKHYKGQLQVIGISVDDDSPERVKEFVQKAGINYPVLMWTRDIVARFGGVPALPTSFVINREGRVMQKHVGLIPPDVYELEIKSLMGMPVNATVETFVDQGQIWMKNAANATELPGLDLSKLKPEQRRAALKKLNTQACSCGCGLTLAQCRVNDSACAVSLNLAKKIVDEIAKPAPPSHSTAN